MILIPRYLYSTDLSKKQFVDVMRSVDTTAWDNGFKSKGMHKVWRRGCMLCCLLVQMPT
jgi:hypothetical protein